MDNWLEGGMGVRVAVVVVRRGPEECEDGSGNWAEKPISIDGGWVVGGAGRRG